MKPAALGAVLGFGWRSLQWRFNRAWLLFNGLLVLGLGIGLGAVSGLSPLAIVQACAAVLLLQIWDWFLAGLRAQNRPDWLQALPGQAMLLRTAALSMALMLGSLATWLIWPLQQGLSVAQVALVISVWLAMQGWALLNPLITVLAAYLILTLVFADYRQISGVPRLLDALDPSTCLALCLLLWLSIAPLFGNRTLARLQHRESAQPWRLWGQQGAKPERPQKQPRANGFVDAWLARRLQRLLRQPNEATVMPRLSAVLLFQGGTWPRAAFTALCIWLGLSALALGLGLWRPALPFAQPEFVVLMGMFLAQFWWVATAFKPLLLTRQREQNLMLLLPGVPRGTALSRAWGQQALLESFFSWAACTLTSLVFVVVWSGAAGLHRMSFAALTLPLLLFALRKPAFLQMGRGQSVGMGLLLGVLVGGALPWWMDQPSELHPIALAVLAGTIALGVGMWRSLQICPEPFPAGRLAQGQATEAAP